MKGEAIARVWSVTRKDGTVLGFTDHDCALMFEGQTFRPDAGLSAKSVVQAAGLSVDNTEALGILSDDAITEGDLAAGRWDGAEVLLWEVDWSDLSRRELIFRGDIGEVTRTGGAFKAELRGLSEPLNRVQGRVYHKLCAADFGGRACGMDLGKPGYQATGMIETILDPARFVIVGTDPQDSGWFARGRFTQLNGRGAGLDGVIKVDRALKNGRREVELWTAPGSAPAVGDKVKLVAGCDKCAKTCREKFGNFINFRGFPHLPSEDWLIAPQAAS